MGTTVATNALLERKGDNVALLISKGLRDTLKISNQSRPNIFDLEISRPEPVYQTVIEVNERIRPVGKHEKELSNKIKGDNGEDYFIEEALDIAQIKQELVDLKALGQVTSIAIVLMHSYAVRDHELKVEQLARDAGFEQVSVSCKVMPRVKLVKRGQTCCVDAYLNPHIFRYLSGFTQGFDEELMK